MTTKERLLARAARLRATISTVDDPLVQGIIRAAIEALEELAAEKDRSSGEESSGDGTDTLDR